MSSFSCQGEPPLWQLLRPTSPGALGFFPVNKTATAWEHQCEIGRSCHPRTLGLQFVSALNPSLSVWTVSSQNQHNNHNIQVSCHGPIFSGASLIWDWKLCSVGTKLQLNLLFTSPRWTEESRSSKADRQASLEGWTFLWCFGTGGCCQVYQGWTQ